MGFVSSMQIWLHIEKNYEQDKEIKTYGHTGLEKALNKLHHSFIIKMLSKLGMQDNFLGL